MSKDAILSGDVLLTTSSDSTASVIRSTGSTDGDRPGACTWAPDSTLSARIVPVDVFMVTFDDGDIDAVVSVPMLVVSSSGRFVKALSGCRRSAAVNVSSESLFFC